jgi:hypothetical protein
LVAAKFSIKQIAGLAIIGSCTVFLSIVGFRLINYGYFGPSIFDDAFFFIRYADNFLATGSFSWNPGGEPTYGNTSQFYQLLVTLVHWLVGQNMVFSLSLASAIGAIVAVAATFGCCWISLASTSSNLRAATIAVTAALLMVDLQIFEFIGMGMETTWAVAAVALATVGLLHVEGTPHNGWKQAAAALLVALVYSVRPDAVLIALAAPAGMVAFGTAEKRRAGLIIIGMAISFIALLLLSFWDYYGSALPISFGTKTPALSMLPAAGRESVANISWLFLWHTIVRHIPEFLLAFAAIAFRSRLSSALKGAVVGVFAFTIYHLYFVVPLMGELGRYYAPMMPIVYLLAAHTIWHLLAKLDPASKRFGLRSMERLTLAILGALVIGKVLFSSYGLLSRHHRALDADQALNTRDKAAVTAANAFFFYDGRLTTLVDALTDKCVIAGTEDGVLSAYARGIQIIDISGLHDPQMAREGFSASRILDNQKPDVLIMPHAWYKEWAQALNDHPAMKLNYVNAGPMANKGPTLALRKNSDCADRVKRALYTE